MKSAYELAMERLEAESGPTKKLTEDQKARIAEVNRVYDARAAEQKLAFEGKIGAAPPEERQGLNDELRSSLASLDEKREKERKAIWDH